MKYDVIDGRPASPRVIVLLKKVEAADPSITFSSLQRNQEAVNYARRLGYSLSSQEELYAGYAAGLPGYNPANRPGGSTHELRNDGVAYPGAYGAPLEDWKVGIDSNNASAVIRELAKLGVTASITYPDNPREGHHINIRKKPGKKVFRVMRTLKKNMKGRDVLKLNKALAELYSPHTYKPYLMNAQVSKNFGAATRQAVIKFQKDHKQSADGIYGPGTREQLNVALRRQKKQLKRLWAEVNTLKAESKKYGGTFTVKGWDRLRKARAGLFRHGVAPRPKLSKEMPPKMSRTVRAKRLKAQALFKKAKKAGEWAPRDWAAAVKILRYLKAAGLRADAPKTGSTPPGAKATKPKPTKPKPSKPATPTESEMKTSNKGVGFIARWEGFLSKPYADVFGHATVGFGYLLHYGGVTSADRMATWVKNQKTTGEVTKAEGKVLLRKVLAETYEPAVRKLFVKGGPLKGLFTQELFDGLASFAYNLGVGSVATGKNPPVDFETIGRAIRERDVKAIAASLVLYRNPGTAAEEGLKRRRLQEADLILGKGYGS